MGALLTALRHPVATYRLTRAIQSTTRAYLKAEHARTAGEVREFEAATRRLRDDTNRLADDVADASALIEAITTHAPCPICGRRPGHGHHPAAHDAHTRHTARLAHEQQAALQAGTLITPDDRALLERERNTYLANGGGNR